MGIKTVSIQENTFYELRIEQPKQSFQLKMKMIIDSNPHLIYAIDRNTYQPLISL